MTCIDQREASRLRDTSVIGARTQIPRHSGPGVTRMENASTLESAPGEFLVPKQVYLIAAICLALGLGIGYVSRGLQRSSSEAIHVGSSAPSAQVARARVPTLDDMK